MIHKPITDFHAKYFAYELTKQAASDSVERLAPVLADAQVDLNPHQVEAALFAFRNPFSKGAILADEVGLGKTIEAGLLLAQRWAERKRHLLVIVPANLRKQWAQELLEKFHMPSVILESASFDQAIRDGNLNPFDQPAVVLCSYQFARNKDPYVSQTPWDLVVIDEAHRLRNVYKGTSKIASAIKDAIAPYPKVLLTATPLQNSLLELYGLVSVIDDHAFGDIQSYRSRFARLTKEEDFRELKERLAPICKRTLRRHVVEYISYTDRHALVQEFAPSADEQRLYDLVSAYLQRPRLYALPASQRGLMTLIMRKLLASSTFAIAATLEGLANKLERALETEASVDAPPEQVPQDWEELDELEDEWGEEGADQQPQEHVLTDVELAELREELEHLREYTSLARSITKNAKGEELLTALRRGFAAAVEAQRSQGAATLQQKAVIFTESRRTQEYLFDLLQSTEFAGQVMMFNGSNNDALSRSIYDAWLEEHRGTDRISDSPASNRRQALVDHFRESASIMIATEAAAEGVNLQFCNLVVNYDLPWNPQRVEQRIGRCHRYGQRFDVVVVNFLNKRNAADQRVYELLNEKFQLFDGVFGASDEILGAIESGVDFEKRIASIYQRCRTPEQIRFEFDELQQDLEEKITSTQRDARDQLLDNFDLEVIEKVRVESNEVLDRLNDRLWRLTRHVLDGFADFDDERHSFEIHERPVDDDRLPPGRYHMNPSDRSGITYRLGHPLAQRILETCKNLSPEPSLIEFTYRGAGKNIAVLEGLVGASGWLACDRVHVAALGGEDTMLFSGLTDDGQDLEPEQGRRMFDLPGSVGGPGPVPPEVEEALIEGLEAKRISLLTDLASKDSVWFDAEMDKLDFWAEDRRNSLRAELEDLDERVRAAKREARSAGDLPTKLQKQREARTLEQKRDEAWRSFDAASRDIDRQKDGLLDGITDRMQQQVAVERLFTLRWVLS